MAFACATEIVNVNKEEEVKRKIEQGQYHIYMICKRKKLFFESCSKNSSGESEIRFYKINENHDKKHIGYKNKEIFIHSLSDGYYDVEFKGHRLRVREFLMINNFGFMEKDFIGDSNQMEIASDLEVMYIGQAFGRNENKTIDYRLRNHEKIQKVALDSLNNGLNEEILVIGLTVGESDLSTALVAKDDYNNPPTLESFIKMHESAIKRPSEGQRVTLFEAALIKYFQPDLNIEYKETFPGPDFTSYNEIYEMEFDYVAIGLDTRTVFARVFSKFKSQRKYLHHDYFPLHSTGKHDSLIEFLEN